MKTHIQRRRLGAAVAGLAAGASLMISGGALAQTAHYPAGGPRLPSWSSLPDWSGIWERDGDNVWDNRIPVGVPQVPPYNAEYQKLADAARQAAAARGGARAGVGGVGGPMQTMPGMMTTLFPMDIQISRTQVTIMSENGSPRRIYTDGRVHSEDTLPSASGHSVGRWVGKELIVDTCCIRKDTRLPGNGPHSEELRVKERFYLRDHKTLVDEITVEDSKAFTKPWTTEKIWYRRPDWESVEYNRDENNR
ncbi:MAG: hypothetical protein JWO33_796, partial [Caulobacteraceae bacterium]|nr:hypothetical protein [Caulobacteraceae bacterium]